MQTAEWLETNARWLEALDPGSGRVYYVDLETQQSSWDPPTHFMDRKELSTALQKADADLKSKPAGDDPAQAIGEAAKKWIDELAHLGGLLDHLPEHFAWRANQCNFAAKVAKEEGDDARDRLRTLQAREFFRAAAEGSEGKQHVQSMS